MAFTNFSAQEKDAFFGLLDEYFQSRPELFGQGGERQAASGIAGTGVSTTAAASVVQRALAANANMTGGSGTSGKSNNPYAASMMSQAGEADVARAVAVGRVAAASLAFSGGGPFSQSQTQGPPPTLPRRGTSNTPASTSLSDRVGLPGLEVDKLVTKKPDLAPSSTSIHVQTSVMSAFKKKPENPSVPIPSAFSSAKNTFGPPPVRRVTSETSAGGDSGGNGTGGGVGTRGFVQRQVVPESEPEVVPEPETQHGEWAEVLYDYSSEDPGDLAIKEGTRVLVTDKTSDDWWTGQLEGREGLFPASYVKLL